MTRRSQYKCQCGKQIAGTYVCWMGTITPFITIRTELRGLEVKLVIAVMSDDVEAVREIEKLLRGI